MDERDGTAVVCVRVDQARADSITEGSEQRTCEGCGTAVWVSPSGLAFVETMGALYYLCVDCAEEAIPYADYVSTVPGAIEVAAAHAGVPVEQIEMAFDIYKAKLGYMGGKPPPPPDTVMGKWG